ncbi:MAG TPA: hypothetical protein VFF29_06125 [Bacteroidota bacterium]|nr:hypothetical protein [Bacteroidota bacterium]
MSNLQDQSPGLIAVVFNAIHPHLHDFNDGLGGERTGQAFPDFNVL